MMWVTEQLVVVWVRALASVKVMCAWARLSTPTMPFTTHMFKYLTGKLIGVKHI